MVFYLCSFYHSHYTPSYSDRRTILQCWYIRRLGDIRLFQHLRIHRHLQKCDIRMVFLKNKQVVPNNESDIFFMKYFSQ